MSSTPLISIGLPTYNRAIDLKRAIESVLAQGYPNLELVISNNASTDETHSICEDFCRRDNRIRYLQQARNIGPAANFIAVLEAARGEFFMWLGDDDWIDPGYVVECARLLVSNPEYDLVCGRGKYFDGDRFVFAELPINLTEDSGSQRVLSYFRQVGMNGLFYGLMRRRILLSLDTQNSVGGDWLMMGQISFLGKVRTLENVSVNRSMAGSSQDVEKMSRAEGLPWLVAKNAHLFIGYRIFRDIGWATHVYQPLRRLARLSLGLRSGMAVARRYSFPDWLNRLIDGWNNLRTHLILRTRLRRGLRRIMRKAL
jgi:glycosyltransferase involved in cell wall biosynthesis